MSGMQRRKGATGERELVQALLSLGMLARRSVQFNGREGACDVLIEGLDWNNECKRTEQLRWRATIAQCKRDARGKPWRIYHRYNGGEWLVIAPLDQYVADSIGMQKAIQLRQQRIAEVLKDVSDTPF